METPHTTLALFAVSDQDLLLSKVNILNSQAQPFDQAKPPPVK